MQNYACTPELCSPVAENYVEFESIPLWGRHIVPVVHSHTSGRQNLHTNKHYFELCTSFPIKYVLSFIFANQFYQSISLRSIYKLRSIKPVVRFLPFPISVLFGSLLLCLSGFPITVSIDEEE